MIPLLQLPSLANRGDPITYEAFETISRLGLSATDLTNALASVNVGLGGPFLKRDGTTPLTGAWNAGAQITVPGLVDSGLSSPAVIFAGVGGLLSWDSSFVWTGYAGGNGLGIRLGGSSLTAPLDVAADTADRAATFRARSGGTSLTLALTDNSATSWGSIVGSSTGWNINPGTAGTSPALFGGFVGANLGANAAGAPLHLANFVGVSAAADMIRLSSVMGGGTTYYAGLQAQRGTNVGQGLNFLVADDSTGTVSEGMRLTMDKALAIQTTTAKNTGADIRGTQADPGTTGSAADGIFGVHQGGRTLNFGIYNASPFYPWIQSTSDADLTQKYGIILNPRGGPVGIGTPDPTEGATIVTKLGLRQTDGQTFLSGYDATGTNKRIAINGTANGWTIYDGQSGSWVAGISQKAGSVGIQTETPYNTFENRGRAIFSPADPTQAGRAPISVVNLQTTAPPTGDVGGIRVDVGNASPFGTPATYNTNGAFMGIMGIVGNNASVPCADLWGINTVVQQSGGVSIAGIGGNFIHIVGYECEVGTTASGGVNNLDPFSGAAGTCRVNGIEVVSHSAGLGRPAAAYTAWVNDATAKTMWFDKGIALSRVASVGISFRDFGDAAGAPFATAIFDLSTLQAATQTLILGNSAVNTNLFIKNSVNHSTYLTLDSGLNAAQEDYLFFADQGSRLWAMGKPSNNHFVIGFNNGAASRTAIELTDDGTNCTMRFPGKWGAGQTLVTLANGANENIPITSSFIKIVGPTAAFSIGGFAGGYDGQILIIMSGVWQTMTVTHNSAGSSAGNKILCNSTWANIVGPATTAGFTVTLYYSANDAAWFVQNTQ